MKHFIPLFSLLTCLVTTAYADVSAVQLYEDCTSAHIPPPSRKSTDWVKIRRCENVVVGVVRGLPWPTQVPSMVTWPGGSVTSDFLICPTSAQDYSNSRLVEFYLKYWDQKGMGVLTGRTQSAQSSTLEAFKEQFSDCAKGDQK